MIHDSIEHRAAALDLADGPAISRALESLLLVEGQHSGGVEPAGLPGSAGQAQGSDVGAVLAERGARYGKFADHAAAAQRLKSVLRIHMGAAKWESLADDQKEALEMVCHKLARIANGDPDYADSWIDIAGYAQLVADRLGGVSR